MNINDSQYLSDILTQADALRLALSRFNPQPLKPIADKLKEGEFDRIILTGMGASFYSLYPTWLYLTRIGIPAMWIDTAELLHYAKGQITSDSMIWIVSQSGRSAEVVAFLDHLREVQPAAMVGITNDIFSPLAEGVRERADRAVLIPIDADPETTVSTRTYLNSLALCQLGARVLCGEDLAPSVNVLDVTTEAMTDYLLGWEKQVEQITETVGKLERLVLLGRGSSIASAYCGALVIGEAGGGLALGMPAGQFRHGPLEMCGPDLTVILFAGAPETRHLNRRLAATLMDCGARLFWVGSEIEGMNVLPIPQVEGIGMPIAEMLPIQLLTVILAQQSGLVPGNFKHIGKVTLVE